MKNVSTIKEEQNGCNMSLFDVGAMLERFHGASYIVLELETFVFLRCQNMLYVILWRDSVFTVEKILCCFLFLIAEYLLVSFITSDPIEADDHLV